MNVAAPCSFFGKIKQTDKHYKKRINILLARAGEYGQGMDASQKLVTTDNILLFFRKYFEVQNVVEKRVNRNPKIQF